MAAYCRVSTDSEEQATSYAAHIEHHISYINNLLDCTLAGTFLDDSISETNTKNVMSSAE